MRIEGSNLRLSLHWTSLAEGNANFSVFIVFWCADDLMAGLEHREEAGRLQGINQHASAPSKYASRRRVGVYAMNPETRPLFLRRTADGKRFPHDHKFRGHRGRVRALYRRPQLGRGTEKIGETSQRKANLQLAAGAFSCLFRRSVPGNPQSQNRKIKSAAFACNSLSGPFPLSRTSFPGLTCYRAIENQNVLMMFLVAAR